ncbi:hypothetical protein BC629DRAFT_1541098 [Irpex lacteus]|nr:hypothetical protein BC629DRAFT_1541098 [Irpex lacteus]
MKCSIAALLTFVGCSTVVLKLNVRCTSETFRTPEPAGTRIILSINRKHGKAQHAVSELHPISSSLISVYISEHPLDSRQPWTKCRSNLSIPPPLPPFFVSLPCLSMGHAAAVYADQLCTYGYGHALWCPEPTQSEDGCTRHVHLGDVGFLDEDGGFRSLFNITVGADHELNAAGVPEGFQPVEVHNNLKSVRHGFLQPRAFCSETVKAHSASGGASVDVTSVAGGDFSYTFKCTSHRGAFLVLDDHATKTSFSPNIPFKQYMLENHASWYAFATDPKRWGLQCEPEDIILVRGTMKTSSWTVGAFFGQVNRLHDFATGGQVASIAGAKFQMSSEYSQSHKWEQRSGPYRALAHLSTPQLISPADTMDIDSVDPRAQVNQPVKDQCIFLSYYKIKYRTFLPKKIVAHADPPSLEEDPDGNGGLVAASPDVDVELDSDHILPRVPLDDILDYILEHSDASVAIASHTDIESLFPDSNIPRDFAAALHMQQPRVVVDDLEAGHIVLACLDPPDSPAIWHHDSQEPMLWPSPTNHPSRASSQPDLQSLQWQPRGRSMSRKHRSLTASRSRSRCTTTSATGRRSRSSARHQTVFRFEPFDGAGEEASPASSRRRRSRSPPRHERVLGFEPIDGASEEASPTRITRRRSRSSVRHGTGLRLQPFDGASENASIPKPKDQHHDNDNKSIESDDQRLGSLSTSAAAVKTCATCQRMKINCSGSVPCDSCISTGPEARDTCVAVPPSRRHKRIRSAPVSSWVSKRPPQPPPQPPPSRLKAGYQVHPSTPQPEASSSWAWSSICLIQ